MRPGELVEEHVGGVRLNHTAYARHHASEAMDDILEVSMALVLAVRRGWAVSVIVATVQV